MNNVIMRKIDMMADWQPLSMVCLIGSVTISAPPTNAAAVVFRGDDGSEVPWTAGEWHDFRSVDLSTIYVKGQSGDVLTVVGGTW